MGEGKNFESSPEDRAERVSEASKKKFIDGLILLTRKEFQPEDRTEGRLTTYELGDKKIGVFYRPEPPDAPRFQKGDPGFVRRLFSEMDVAASLSVSEVLPGGKQQMTTTYLVRKHGETEYEERVVNLEELREALSNPRFLDTRPEIKKKIEARLEGEAVGHDLGFNTATEEQFDVANRILDELIAQQKSEK